MTLSIESSEVPCKRIGSSGWSFGVVKTCYITGLAESSDLEISTPRDETVEALWIGENVNISLLPTETFEKFPNLLGYSANNCSVKSVKKENFQNLNSLKKIYLSGNLIETIYSDTFESLKFLQEIHLGKEKA